MRYGFRRSEMGKASVPNEDNLYFYSFGGNCLEATKPKPPPTESMDHDVSLQASKG
jgi:hypothetical protein